MKRLPYSLTLDSYYSPDVVAKLRQQEQTQSLINKPCILYVKDRSLLIVDRMTKVDNSDCFVDVIRLLSISLTMLSSIGCCRNCSIEQYRSSVCAIGYIGYVEQHIHVSCIRSIFECNRPNESVWT
jgi:hypothetical protein